MLVTLKRMSANNEIAQALSEAIAIRLYNSVVATNQSIVLTPKITENQTKMFEQKSIESVRSANEFGNSCRICRWNRSDMEIVECPCHCKGSVGFIHLKCLKRWIMQRGVNHCEICNETFEIPEEKISIRQMFKSFCSYCAAPILRHALYNISLLPLSHVVLQQVLILLENINQSPNEQLKVSEVVMASCALLTSSSLFFHFFEFITTRLMLTREILRQWWLFGNATDFRLVELENEILDFFN